MPPSNLLLQLESKKAEVIRLKQALAESRATNDLLTQKLKETEFKYKKSQMENAKLDAEIEKLLKARGVI